jgi:hypothetical protein
LRVSPRCEREDELSGAAAQLILTLTQKKPLQAAWKEI